MRTLEQGHQRASLLNIGCGARFHPDWVNVDLAPIHSAVAKCDIRCGLPYPSSTFDAVYHSHVLEHLECDRALPFLSECHRVLKNGGVIRVAVPDLETIVREYLKWFELTKQGDPAAEANYDWVMLELYDQAVRRKSGGGMLDYLRSGKVANIEYVRQRCGDEIAGLASLPQTEAIRGVENKSSAGHLSLRARAGRALKKFVVGEDYARLPAARFLESGELHRWMYDRVSLPRLLRGCGFVDARQVIVNESRIPMWTKYGLDADPASGRAHKPESLFVEAIKQ